MLDILKGPHDICECQLALMSFHVSLEKIEHVMAMVHSKLASKDIGRP